MSASLNAPSENSGINVELDHIESLLQQYETQGPRYTSYPTAPQFHQDFGRAEYLSAVYGSNEDPVPNPLSLYLHIPFCHSLCYYCGCNKIITPDLDKGRDYLDYLYKEIELRSRDFASGRLVQQVHFGGGTPNFLSPVQLREVLDTLAQHFHFDVSKPVEIGIEIDPRWVSPEDIHELASYGFNRMSFGIQDFDPAVQRAVNRIQSVEAVEQLVVAARDSGVESISMDLIYGLPKQTVDSFSTTLEQVIALKPDRVSLYSYAHMPDKIKSQRFIRSEDVATGSEKLQLFLLGLKAFCTAGYDYIGMDHFALSSDPLAQAKREGSLQRNFQGYSTHSGCDIVGMGVSAISHIGDAFSQSHGNIVAYQKALDRNEIPLERGVALSRDDGIRAKAIQSIMCSGALNLNELSLSFDLDAQQYFREEWEQLGQLLDDGLVTVTESELRVTEVGRLFLRNIAMLFDAYLPTQSTTARGRALFSGTV